MNAVQNALNIRKSASTFKISLKFRLKLSAFLNKMSSVFFSTRVKANLKN